VLRVLRCERNTGSSLDEKSADSCDVRVVGEDANAGELPAHAELENR
jgi:hypothetical protein